MADQKITELTADTSPSSDDLIVIVNDPSGTPTNKKVTLANLVGLVADIIAGLDNLNMSDRTRSFFVPISRFGARSGSPVYETGTNDLVYWLLDDSSTEIVASSFMAIPADFAGGNITVKSHWAMASATSGNVVLDAQYSFVADGEATSGITGIGNTTQSVPGTAGLLKTTTHTTTLSGLAAGDLVKWRFLRVGGDGSDTATGDLLFLGLTIEYTADM